MAVLDIVDPGLSASRGKLLFELQSCVYGHAVSLFMDEEIEIDQFRRTVMECIKMLGRSSKCLKNEMEWSNNKKYEDSVNNSIHTLSNILKSMG